MEERTEKLVQIAQAQDEWEGTILVGYLQDNQIEASLQQPMAMPPFDGAERLTGSKRVLGVFVLEHEQERARRLVQEFKAAITDESVLAETAAAHLDLDKETIQRLRRELVEEKRTFEALGWIGVVFLGAAAALWAIWPQWLKMAIPPSGMRWVMVLLFALGAMFAGNWASRRM